MDKAVLYDKRAVKCQWLPVNGQMLNVNCQMKISMKKFNTLASIGLIIAMVAILMGPFAQVAYAAALLNKSDTMSSSKISTLSDHVIVFRTPSGAQGGATPDTITVTFPSGFAMGTFALANFDIDTSAGGQANCTAPTYTDRALAATNGS